MAHFPRWIDDSSVDSQAMFSAVLWFQYSYPDQYELHGLQELFMVEHKPYMDMVELNGERPLKHPWKACTQLHCKRCRDGQGGYQFRWYDTRWYAKYVELARKGSWKMSLC